MKPLCTLIMLHLKWSQKYCLVVTVIFQCRCSIDTAYNQDISISSQCSPDSLEKNPRTNGFLMFSGGSKVNVAKKRVKICYNGAKIVIYDLVAHR